MGKEGTSTAAGIVLAAGALIALRAWCVGRDRAFRVPVGVVGTILPDGRVRVIFSRFRRSEGVEIFPLRVGEGLLP